MSHPMSPLNSTPKLAQTLERNTAITNSTSTTSPGDSNSPNEPAPLPHLSETLGSMPDPAAPTAVVASPLTPLEPGPGPGPGTITGSPLTERQAEAGITTVAPLPPTDYAPGAHSSQAGPGGTIATRPTAQQATTMNPKFPAAPTHHTFSTLGSQRHDRFVSPAGVFPTSQSEGWEEAFERQREQRWRQKVEADLRGWRGGNGAPRSCYTKTAVPTNSYFGQPPTGRIGKHLPKEIVRIERDWSEGEVCQFETGFPLELEGRVTPKQWAEFISTINDHLTLAYSVRGAVLDNLVAILTWWTSLLWKESHFQKELRKVEDYLREANRELFNPAGLNVLSPRDLALQFMEIEYY